MWWLLAWVSKKCSGINGSLSPDPKFRWVGCLINAQLIEGRLMRELYGDSKLEDLHEFRYLSEMLLLGAAVCWLYLHVAGVRWGKSGQQLPLLTNHYLPLLNQGWVYSTSVRSQMKHESETWVMTTETLNGLWHTKWHDPLDLLHQH